MHQADFERHVGTENICASIADALKRADSLYQAQHAAAESSPEKVTPRLTR
jgi:hypothetical protein